MKQNFFSERLIQWYQANKRELPWRTTKDPYRIWLSEIILQQTRVAQGLPYYERFTETFPTVEALAAAEEKEVLRLWQGLGYYSRARNLHACAKMIVNEYGGKFPVTYQELLKLKGVGKYTAAAIASFAFCQAVPAIDGNAFRLMSRVFGISEDIADAKTFRTFFETGQELIPSEQADLYNQAVMEFGATHCTHKKPACAGCIFEGECYARLHGQQEQLPVKTKKIKVKKRHFHYFVFKYEDRLLMKERQEKDIWQGLYDFYLLEEKAFQDLDDLADHEVIAQVLAQQAVVEKISDPFKHILSHQHIFAQFFEVQITDQSLYKRLINNNLVKSYSYSEVYDLPKPILVANYLEANIF